MVFCLGFPFRVLEGQKVLQTAVELVQAVLKQKEMPRVVRGSGFLPSVFRFCVFAVGARTALAVAIQLVEVAIRASPAVPFLVVPVCSRMF